MILPNLKICQLIFKLLILCLPFTYFQLSYADHLSSKIVAKQWTYEINGQSHKGFIAYPQNRKDLTAVIIIHEWWGHNAYVQERAKMLAKEGFFAFAIDMYGRGKVAEHPQDARTFAKATLSQFDQAKMRFSAARNQLNQFKEITSNKLAAIGYCFGGGVAYNMLRAGEPLQAIGIFHGSVSPLPATKDQTDFPPGSQIRVYTGGQDKMIPPSQLAEFEKEMKKLGVTYQLHVYPDATHSFTNKDADLYAKRFQIPVAYNQDADQASWENLLEMLKAL